MATILLLDDNHDMLTALTEALALHEYEVVPGYTGQDGMKFLERTSNLPDMIISDLYMPDMTGLEFLNEVRHHPIWANIPFAIMSGQTADEKKAIAAGADAFVIKPFRFTELEDTLNRLVR